MTHWNIVCAAISEATQSEFTLTNTLALNGGDTNSAWRINGSQQSGKQTKSMAYFVKFNDLNKIAMFTAESAGLKMLANTHTVRVPQVITTGSTDSQSFLVTEFLELSPSGDSALLGKQLADLHRVHAKQFGWDQDNTLSITPQHNNWTSDWIDFWREQRLAYQLDLAEHNGYTGKLQQLGHELMSALPKFFINYQPAPSLLHGDLWGGNHAFLTAGTPVIFDPAPYFGDREADIAMTELFGGYDNKFYAAYHAAYPLDAGYQTRKNLYNLYHIINHGNLFGGGYFKQAEHLMQNLLK